MIKIAPPTLPGVLSMACIGLRDVIPSIDLIPVKKIHLKFDISGDTKDAIITNKHAILGNSANVFEIITIELDVPTDLKYSPVLTVYAYDNVMGFLGQRLLGVANIPLERHCEKILSSLSSVTGFMKSGSKQKSSLMLEQDATRPEDVDLIAKDTKPKTHLGAASRFQLIAKKPLKDSDQVEDDLEEEGKAGMAGVLNKSQTSAKPLDAKAQDVKD